MDVLNKFKNNPNINIDILLKRIENFNSPTNQDKLLKIFEIYDIKLSNEDLKAIKSRDLFLHGNFNKFLNDIYSTEEVCLLYLLTLRLYFLIIKLILKISKCDFYILNILQITHDNLIKNKTLSKIIFQEDVIFKL